MTPETFKVNDKEYQSVGRARGLLLGVRDLGSCCREWLCVSSTGASFIKAGNKTKIRNHAIYAFSLLAYNDAVNESTVNEFKVGNVVVPVFEPKEIPGTSGECNYRTLILADKGVVAYRADRPLIKNPRIRIAKNNQLEDWKPISLKGWQTQAPTHLAHTGGTCNETKVLIARGLDALYQLDAI